MKLTLPHITQTANNIRGDCGPACIAMCANTTINAVYKTGLMQRGQFAHIANDLRPLLYRFGIRSTFERYNAAAIRHEIKANKHPVICLIEYGRLPDELKRDARYNGSHFVLAAGCDENHIMIHDPLGNADTGKYVPYADVVLNGALRGGQCLVVMREYGVEEEEIKKRPCEPL